VEEYDELVGLIDSDDAGDIVRGLHAFHEADRKAPVSYDVNYWKTVLQEVLVAGKSIEGSFNEEEGEVAVIAPVHRVHFLRRYRWWAAASIILLLGVGAYFFAQKTTNQVAVTPAAKELKNDVAPGGNKAVLTLADGTKIILDSAANGNLAQQGSARVVKLANGQIAYDVKGSADKEIMWNTMRTPAGGQYQVTLPDGTKVWLNAASSITYPAAFVSKNRQVKITGEVYFEVATLRLRSGQKMPFIVDIDGKSTVEVLGTHFNINAYEDESAIKTTLLEGAVKIVNRQSAILKPGEQAVVSDNSPLTIDHSPDLDQVMAWKNGLFSFNNADLRSVMRQLERWYDIKVEYRGDVPDISLKGKMRRNVNLSVVLDFLQKTGVKFYTEGKTIIIL
jgi:ferric-dicitrate binding protein FerR (iron transport regulator)